MTGRRLSLLAQAPSVSVLGLAAVDDATDKDLLQQAKATGICLKESQSPGGNLVAEDTLDPQKSYVKNKPPTSAQIAEHYKNCIDLSSANKITNKNAFRLHLIDYMAKMLQQEAEEDENKMMNFQMGACAIDAGSKIYACRVDAMHAEAVIAMSGLGNVKFNEDTDNPMEVADGEDSCNEQDVIKKTEKKKGKKKSAGNVIEKNIEKQEIDLRTLRADADPWVQQWMSSESGKAGKCSLRDIYTYKDTGMTILPWVSEKKYEEIRTEQKKHLSADKVDIQPLIKYLRKIADRKIKICPEFETFEFGSKNMLWNNGEQTTLNSTEHRFDLNAEVENTLTSCGVNAEDGLMDGGDNFYHSFGGGDVMTDAESTRMSEHRMAYANPTQQKPPLTDITNITALMDALSLKPLEYSYFKQDYLRMIDGPTHWKVKQSQATVPGAVKKKGVRKVKEVLTFKSFPDTLETKPFKKTRKRKKLSQDEIRIVEMTNETTLNLNKAGCEPDQTNEELNDHSNGHEKQLLVELSRIILKPWLVFGGKRLSKDGLVTTEEVEVANYDYNNQLDSSFCPPDLQNLQADNNDDFNTSADLFNGGGGDDVDDMATSMQHMDITSERLGSVLDENNLVQQPYRVENILVAFAKTAKKIDIKRVKKSMWYILTNYHLCEESEISNVGDLYEYLSSNELCKAATDDNTEVIDAGGAGESQPSSKKCLGVHLFSKLYKLVRSKLTGQTAENLSISIGFICLLHLANEKSLSISTHGDGNDLIIRQQ